VNVANGTFGKRDSGLALAGFILITFAAPMPGVLSPPDAWYAGLDKPSWNPPGWIFGPAWTLLYTLMAIAACLVWRRGGFTLQRGPLALYLLQLALNAAWSPLFFGAHAIGWALVDIVALWIAITLTLATFRRVSRASGLLFVPYLAWVTFATALNFMIWRMN
jgi:tryptophan-rich sensory protein